MATTPNSAARPVVSVRPGARDYAAFIRSVLGISVEVADSLSFAEAVELTFSDPKRGLGIEAFRASDAYVAAKAAREAAREREAAEKKAAAEAKRIARDEKNRAAVLASAIRLGIVSAKPE